MKKNKMNKSIHQFNKACAEMGEYIEAFAIKINELIDEVNKLKRND